MKGDLDQAQKELAEARPKVALVEEQKEKLGQANEKAVGSKNKVE